MQINIFSYVLREEKITEGKNNFHLEKILKRNEAMKKFFLVYYVNKSCFFSTFNTLYFF
jgi:hypothetical protein